MTPGERHSQLEFLVAKASYFMRTDSDMRIARFKVDTFPYPFQGIVLYQCGCGHEMFRTYSSFEEVKELPSEVRVWLWLDRHRYDPTCKILPTPPSVWVPMRQFSLARE